MAGIRPHNPSVAKPVCQLQRLCTAHPRSMDSNRTENPLVFSNYLSSQTPRVLLGGNVVREIPKLMRH